MAALWWFRGPSPHFTWNELAATDTGLTNWPISAHARMWLTRLAWGVLEPLRREYGPIIITSGYRTLEVNEAVGGSTNSQHMSLGNWAAADLYPSSGVSGYAVAEWLYENQKDLPLDQVIIYATPGHVHVSTGGDYRKSFLEWDGEEYESWQPTG